MLTPVILTPGNKIRLKTITQSKIYQKEGRLCSSKSEIILFAVESSICMDDGRCCYEWLLVRLFLYEWKGVVIVFVGHCLWTVFFFHQCIYMWLTLSFMVELIGRIGSYWLLKHVASLSLCLFQFLSYQTDTLNTFIISMSQIPCFQTLFPLKFH